MLEAHRHRRRLQWFNEPVTPVGASDESAIQHPAPLLPAKLLVGTNSACGRVVARTLVVRHLRKTKMSCFLPQAPHTHALPGGGDCDHMALAGTREAEGGKRKGRGPSHKVTWRHGAQALRGRHGAPNAERHTRALVRQLKKLTRCTSKRSTRTDQSDRSSRTDTKEFDRPVHHSSPSLQQEEGTDLLLCA